MFISNVNYNESVHLRKIIPYHFFLAFSLGCHVILKITSTSVMPQVFHVKERTRELGNCCDGYGSGAFND